MDGRLMSDVLKAQAQIGATLGRSVPDRTQKLLDELAALPDGPAPDPYFDYPDPFFEGE